MERRTEDIVVPENADIVEKIIQLAEESKAWIYLSNDLVARLGKIYPPRDYAGNQHGSIFCIHGDFDGFQHNKLYVDIDIVWNKVSAIPKKNVYIAQDPDIIYFLS